MRIALYGGSFDPPHLAHQLACLVALTASEPPVDEVWMVPTFQHAFDKALAPFIERHAMCVLAARVFGERVVVSRIEEELGGASYTIRTVEALRVRHPQHEFVLLIGADLLAERARWNRWEALRTMVSFLVIGRTGTGDEGLEPCDRRVPLALPELSSTEARRRVAAGEPTSGLLDEAVADYVAKAGLYRR